MTGERFAALCHRYPNATAILTHAGNPLFAVDDPSRIPTPRPALIIIGSDTPELRAYCQAGLVRLAFVARHGPRTSPPASLPKEQALLDESFEVIRQGPHPP